ncbi:TonB-dependent receptor [Hallella multisaccharivorax DSM 17128]|uniref:TonB-dependent receptor n=1 Tax=Hallella multisaccharivorax DSM 17128 TaxID=688246 RepID=F8N8C8_9BACT|nr:TonB-dependent receptor [Hallella multisaccharivorax]EGN57607.1 TonB-dependent receptor [Hallella multisaccharivorax DSM 17128]
MKRKKLALAVLFSAICSSNYAQTITGRIISAKDHQSIGFASVQLKESHLIAYTDESGHFILKNVPKGKNTVVVSCLGYASQTVALDVSHADEILNLSLKEDNLQLDEVEVVAKRKRDESTTSYIMDRNTLDNQQIINLSDITSLLPGGKIVNPSLMNDTRIGLRSGRSERGNASFGTAVEVDGVRMDNNAAVDETAGASTRALSASNVESVEIVSGIPSVEYGDLSNGVVKVNTRKGRSPFIVEGSINQHTRQIALNKGFEIGAGKGLLNLSMEHARSFADAASPHTAYQRNAFSLNYMNVLMKKSHPLTINVGLRGNIGGYSSESDPDEELDNYTKSKDNSFIGNMRMDWLLNKSWITSLHFMGSITYSNRNVEYNTHTNSAGTRPYVHARTEGYNIAEDYDANPNANIILGPVGYWYTHSYDDSKPLNYSLKLKAGWTRLFGSIRSSLMIGADYTGSENNGRGVYYEDMRYAPTWREYRYDELPTMNNLALYAEEKVNVPTSDIASFELTAGLREDITMIGGSEYGNVASLSPRVSSRYIFFENKKAWVKELNVYAGWGKSVKLPGFQVLFPPPSYSDLLAFSSTSDAQNRSFYAYYTHPSGAVYNPGLKWQYNQQWDLGFEMRTKIADVSLSFYHNKTFNPYMATTVYRPFEYKYTTPSALQRSGIDVASRTFSIDPVTGVVTVGDITGKKGDVVLPYEQRRTYVTNREYVNASPLSRYGLEWIVDFAQIRPLRTKIRLDGDYYHYKGVDETLFADVPQGLSIRQTDGQLFQYIGYYRGGSASSASYSANASASNGSVSSQVNLNATLTTHIPKIRLIVALRLESSLYRSSRSMSTHGYVYDKESHLIKGAYDGTTENQTVVVFPEYYSTWNNPTERKSFIDDYTWAKENDKNLYNDLSQLLVRTNYPYTLNPNRLSAFWSANLSVTKEIGDHVSISFYANNFLNTMKRVRSSQTDLETSLFGSSYVPSFYYGLSLRLKI